MQCVRNLEFNLVGGAVAAGGGRRGTVATRGTRWVATAGAAGETAGLLELGDLDGLTDSLKVDSDDAGGGDSVGGGWDSVGGGGSTVGGGDTTVAATVTAAESAGSAGGGFFLEEDLADLFEEGGVYVLALGGLVAGGDGAVAAAAAAGGETATEAATVAASVAASETSAS